MDRGANVYFVRQLRLSIIPYLLLLRLRYGRVILLTERERAGSRLAPLIKALAELHTAYFSHISAWGYRAAAAAVEVTERLYISENLDRILRPLTGYFKSPDAVYLLKKMLVIKCEHMLRDIYALEDLGEANEWTINYIVTDPLEERLLAEGQGNFNVMNPFLYQLVVEKAAQYGFMAYIYIRCVLFLPLGRPFGLRKQIGGHFLIAVENHWGMSRDDIHNDSFLVDGGAITADQILAVLINPRAGKLADYEQRGVKAINLVNLRVCRLRVNASYWLLDLLPRALLCLPAFLSMRGSQFASLKTEMVKMIYHSIKWELLFNNYDIKALLVREHCEFTYNPIIQHLVGQRYGVKTIMAPISQVDRPGGVSSYYSADVNCVSGRYFPATYGQTWNPKTEVKQIGLLFNSRDGGSKMMHDILEQKPTGSRMLALFTDKDVNLLETENLHRNLLSLLLRVLREIDNVFVVAKVKSDLNELLFGDYAAEFEHYAEKNKLLILDAHERYVSPQLLAAHSDLILSGGSSVAVESLGLRRPNVVITDPGNSSLMAASKTPFQQRFWNKIFFEQVELALVAVRTILANSGHQTLSDSDWNEIFQMFDPFHDGKALNRIRQTLLGIVATGADPQSESKAIFLGRVPTNQV